MVSKDRANYVGAPKKSFRQTFATSGILFNVGMSPLEAIR